MAMKLPGQVAILRFPSVDLSEGKSRPVLLLAKARGAYDDWLICMISSQVHQALSEIDEEGNELVGITIMNVRRRLLERLTAQGAA